MQTEVLEIEMRDTRFRDLTGELQRFAAQTESDGLVQVFAPHATAGLALMETGSGSEADLEATLERLLPRDHDYVHRHGSKGHGADHVIPAFISPSVTIPVLDGKPELGAWQSLILVDLNRDNPLRRVRLSFIPASKS
jgi:secondary thiamine-phosphate synthase enzyme